MQESCVKNTIFLRVKKYHSLPAATLRGDITYGNDREALHQVFPTLQPAAACSLARAESKYIENKGKDVWFSWQPSWLRRSSVDDNDTTQNCLISQRRGQMFLMEHLEGIHQSCFDSFSG